MTSMDDCFRNIRTGGSSVDIVLRVRSALISSTAISYNLIRMGGADTHHHNYSP